MAKGMIAEFLNYGMSTVITHQAFGKDAEKSLKAVGEEAIRIEGILSCFIPESEISRINKWAGLKCERVSPDTFEILSRAVEFSNLSRGLFDVTIGPLVAIWKEGAVASKCPDAVRIKKLLPLVNYKDLILNLQTMTVGLRMAGQFIDLGGIGKGFAGDKFIEVFKRYDIASAFTNIGGNVVTVGSKPDGSPWKVGIRHPRQEEGLIGYVNVSNKAVVTSGDYQRYFIDREGNRFHHILDPFTGYPSSTDLLSVTVVSNSSTTADALSTILFVAGVRKGFELLKRFSGTEAIFVDKDLRVYVTAGLKECFRAREGMNVLYLKKEKI